MNIKRMPSSGMGILVAVVRIVASKECIDSFVRVKRIIRLRTNSLVTANALPSPMVLFVLMTEAIRSSETSVATRAAPHHILEDGILHIHSRENLKSYVTIII
jgi:hypothetical protein